ncbi:hypothetical protein PG987_000724 [Apiospora arundinis]
MNFFYMLALKAREANLDHAIHLRIALEQPNLEIFEEILYNISTPQHPNYGHFLSRDALKEMMKPHQQSTEAVLNWLHSFGVGNTCLSNDGKNTTSFEPVFPAACPYVTSVGGVTDVEPESAFQISSGGFSNIWPRPAYKNASVMDYLQKIGSRYKGFYNQSSRDFPDVAAQANNVLLVNYGPAAPTSGTSASAPIFAAIISLLNNARIKKGMPPLGFLNPGYTQLRSKVAVGPTSQREVASVARSSPILVAGS